MLSSHHRFVFATICGVAVSACSDFAFVSTVSTIARPAEAPKLVVRGSAVDARVNARGGYAVLFREAGGRDKLFVQTSSRAEPVLIREELGRSQGPGIELIDFADGGDVIYSTVNTTNASGRILWVSGVREGRILFSVISDASEDAEFVGEQAFATTDGGTNAIRELFFDGTGVPFLRTPFRRQHPYEVSVPSGFLTFSAEDGGDVVTGHSTFQISAFLLMSLETRDEADQSFLIDGLVEVTAPFSGLGAVARLRRPVDFKVPLSDVNLRSIPSRKVLWFVSTPPEAPASGTEPASVYMGWLDVDQTDGSADRTIIPAAGLFVVGLPGVVQLEELQEVQVSDNGDVVFYGSFLDATGLGRQALCRYDYATQQITLIAEGPDLGFALSPNGRLVLELPPDGEAGRRLTSGLAGTNQVYVEENRPILVEGSEELSVSIAPQGVLLAGHIEGQGSQSRMFFSAELDDQTDLNGVLAMDLPGDASAVLVTSSPAILSAPFQAPPQPFSLAFDYQFLTPTGTVTVALAGLTLFEAEASTTTTELQRVTLPVDPAALPPVPPGSISVLRLGIDGPTGSVVRFDNVSVDGSLLPGGDFEGVTLNDPNGPWLALNVAFDVIDPNAVADPNAVVVTAGADETVVGGGGVYQLGGAVVSLQTTTSVWTQIGGPAVVLSDPSILDPTFTVPTVSAPTDLSFQLTGTGADGASSFDTVTIRVEPAALADGDGDGASDTADNCPAISNPSQSDLDADGAGDACDPCPRDPVDDGDGDLFCGDVDNCPADANPAQADGDGDGAGDVCDACPADAANDADADGVCGDVDNCPTTTNDDQSDLDGDGVGDVCDADDDGDGVPDTSDNCAVEANADQDDLDVDGLGDACDDDADGDGVLDDVDNCLAVSNPTQADADQDGLGDACDDGGICVVEPGVATGLAAARSELAQLQAENGRLTQLSTLRANRANRLERNLEGIARRLDRVEKVVDDAVASGGARACRHRLWRAKRITVRARDALVRYRHRAQRLLRPEVPRPEWRLLRDEIRGTRLELRSLRHALRSSRQANRPSQP
jgi:hypothetical protein